MSDVYRRILSGLSLRTLSTSPAPSAKGDINVDLASGNLQYHNGTVLNKISTETNTLALQNKTLDASLNTIINLVDANIKAAAAIAYSKLNLTGSVVNADISNTAAIAYSKLTLTGSIVNADISASAAIVYSKLALAGSIQLSDQANLAANSLIGNTTGSSATPTAVPVASTNTASAVVIRDSSGNFAAGTITGTLSANADVNLGSHKITNLANGVSGTDGVNLNQLQNALSGVQWRPETDLLDTVDTTLPTGASATIDSVSVTNGMRVLFTNLVSNNNEVYVASGVGTSLVWTAALDNDRTSAAPVRGDSVLILQGSTYSEASYNYNGTSWIQFNGATQIQAGTGLSKSGNTLSMSQISAHSVLGNATNSVSTPSPIILTSSPTANTVVQRDANSNTQLNNLIENGQSIATAAGTTTLTVSSPYFTQFTGSSTQTCALPDARTLTQFQAFYIANRSTGTVNVNDANGTTLAQLLGTTQAIFTVTSIGSLGGSWDVSKSSASSGSGGTKNYLTTYINNTGNGDFEQGSTAGWSLFNTTLTNKIPTGSITAGATSITTFSVAGGGLLGGTYALLTSASSAFSAGQGFITDQFTIDAEDKAKMLTISFAYTVAAGATNLNFSGTSSNTFSVYVYDVDNSAWIQPAGVYNLVQNSGAGKCVATFQTPINSAHYRLAIVAINASGGACGMYWDDFVVGPQTQVMGPAMSDWTSYSLTIGAVTTAPTLGTTTTNQATWRRVGDSMEIKYDLIQTSAGTAGSGTYLFPLPTGYSIDTSKITTSTTGNAIVVGSSRVQGTSGDDGIGIVAAYDATHLTLQIYNSAVNGASAQVVTGGVTGTWTLQNSSVVYSFTAKVPISGWSSNTVMSSDTDTRVVDFNGLGGTTPAVTAFVTDIPFVSQKDSHAAWNGSQYVVPVSGDYSVSSTVADNSTNSWALYVYRNGVQYSIIAYQQNGFYASGSIIIPNCKAGDTLSVRVGISTTIATSRQLSIFRISGPAVVAASEKVYLQYTGNAGQAITSSTDIPFATKVVDSHNAWNGSSFSAPRSGWYNITGGIRDGGTAASPNFYLYLNGSQNQFSGGSSAASGSLWFFSTGIYLKAGDSVSIRSDLSFTLGNSAILHHIEISSQG